MGRKFKPQDTPASTGLARQRPTSSRTQLPHAPSAVTPIRLLARDMLLQLGHVSGRP